MSKSRTNFNKMKYEIADEIGVNLKDGYNGDITARDAGRIGGGIVKRVFSEVTGKNYNK